MFRDMVNRSSPRFNLASTNRLKSRETAYERNLQFIA